VEKEGQVPLSIWRLTADVDLWHLSRKRFFINSIWLYEADLLIKQQEEGSLQVSGSHPASPPKTEIAPEKQGGSTGFLDNWGIGLIPLPFEIPAFAINCQYWMNAWILTVFTHRTPLVGSLNNQRGLISTYL
jgi:hypothetical protein